MATGTIVKINPYRGMVAVQTSEGASIFELLSSVDINEGDQVSWEPDTSLGDTKLINLTRRCESSVYFQNHHVPAHLVADQLRL